MKVTEKMKLEIIERYPDTNSSILAQEMGMSINTLRKWVGILRLKKSPSFRNPNRVTEQEENIIREFYPDHGADHVAKLIGKTPHAISELARKMGIKCKVSMVRKGSLEPLFNNSIESFYWLGFIAADGYVSKTGHLLISQAEQDKDNIYRLAKFLSGEVRTIETSSGYRKKNSTVYRLAIADKILGPKIYELFKIPLGQKKTYTEISVDFIKSQEEAMAFLCGFIDGDGSRYSSYFKIECDLSQLEMFKNLMDKIPQYKGYLLKQTYKKQQNKSFCLFNTNKELMNALLYFAKMYNIGSSRKFT